MTATISETGVAIQTYDEILEEIVTSLGVALSLTDAQTDAVRTSVQSSLGQLARIEAEREARVQEALLAVYDALSFEAEGTHLDRVVRLLGVTREPAATSRVLGTATGTAATVIPNGTRIQYDGDESVWTVVDGPYTIGGGGTVTSVAIESEATDDLEPALGTDWTILDAVVGLTSFESTSQPRVGSAVETDASLRSRAATEAFRRGSGPAAAIDAAVSAVDGVTFVRTFENRTLVTNADGIPAKAVNVVVEGGADADIAEAIFASRPAGAELYGSASASVVDDYGFAHTVGFDRVVDVNMWIRCTLTTSTAEEAAPTGITTTVAELLLEQADALAGVGSDILPWRLASKVDAAGYPGIDNVVVELSLDGSSWSTAKRSVSIRQRAAFSSARITVLED